MRAKAALTIQFLERKRDEYIEIKAEIERLENELSLKDEEDLHQENRGSV